MLTSKVGCLLVCFATALLGCNATLVQKLSDPTIYDTKNATTTLLGCECKAACQTSALFYCDSQAFCLVKDKACAFGTAKYSVTQGDYYDYCVYGEYKPYEGLSAKEKHATVMGQVLEQKGQSGQYPSGVGLGGIFLESVRATFTTFADVFPSPPQRTKYIHSVGVHAPFKWVANTAASKYSGIFKDGTDYGIIRFSSATAVSDSANVAPGIAVKLFRDGITSANFPAMPGVDAQTCSETNFFAQNFSNHIGSGKDFAKQLLEKKFWQASFCPQMVGLSDVAKTTGALSFPYEITLVPQIKATCECSKYSACLSHLITAMPSGTAVFEIYAKETPTGCPQKSACGTSEHIGQFVTTGPAVTSKFGDNNLFFRHQYMEDDFKLKPDWLKQIDKVRDCGMSCSGKEPPTVDKGCSNPFQPNPPPPPSPEVSGDWRLHSATGMGQPCPFSQSSNAKPCPFRK